MMKTVRKILKQGEWLTAEQMNALQVNPPSQKSLPASDWARRGRAVEVFIDKLDLGMLGFTGVAPAATGRRIVRWLMK